MEKGQMSKIGNMYLGKMLFFLAIFEDFCKKNDGEMIEMTS